MLDMEPFTLVLAREELAAQAEEEVGLYTAAKRGKGKEEVDLVGIEGLRCYDQYGPPRHAEKKYRNDFKPNLINEVVVRKWVEKAPKEG